MNEKNVGLMRFLRIFKSIKLPWILLSASVICAVLNYIFTLSLADLTASVVDKSGNIANAQLAKYVTAGVVVTLTTTATILLNGIASEKINLGLRKKLWAKMIYLPRKMYDEDKGEGLVSRITDDCTYSSILFTVLVECISAIVGICIYYTDLFRTNSHISALSILVLPVSVLIGWLYGKLRYVISRNNQQKLSETTGYLIERTYNLNLIRSANMQDEELKLGTEKFNQQYKIEVQKGLADTLNTFINAALPVLTMGIVFLSGGTFVNKGLMTAGGVYAFYLIANSASVIFANLIDYFGSIRGAVGAMERVTRTLEEAEEDIEKGEIIETQTPLLTFENIEFAYKEKSVLSGLKMNIPKNKVTVIIGANGAGKSTLFRLIERYYSPDNGVVLLDGKEAESYKLSSWRSLIGYIPQENSLMSGTIRSNLSFGNNKEYTDAELDAAFKKLGLDGFTDVFPDKYDTKVTPGGKNFSGGQRQVIALARAVLYDPEILLLDEATCNIDAHTANVVSSALFALMKNRTTVIIAHDLKTILCADHAIILRDGAVVYSGEPKEVLNEVDAYRNKVMNTPSEAIAD